MANIKKIKCPNCGAEFDISSYLNFIEEEFIKKVEVIIKEMKKQSDK
ncbi:MAG: hypothetical protein J7J96_04040 [Sulfurimonas sp.]|nr:hypothetical protein [Sulfurimonas sp.]